MNIEVIKSLKERAKEMLEDNYNRKIGDEEIYTIICELENFYTAYKKEKEKNKKIDEFCRKELAFEKRLKRENREPDEFNQGRFYVCENIRKIIEGE